VVRRRARGLSEGGDTPVSWLLVERGWKVIDADGKEIGRVHEVVGDSGEDIFNGLTVTHGLLGKSRYVPAEEVVDITDGEVRLALTDDDVSRLDEHEPPPPSEQLRP
jgi:hypothetical protein